VQAEINQATADYNQIVDDTKSNPWKSQAGITGTIAKATEAYNRTLTRLQAKQTVLSNNIQRAENRADTLSQRITNETKKTQQLSKEELAYYINRAKADIKAEQIISKEAETKELARYFPEYIESYKKKITAAEKTTARKQTEIKRVQNELTNYGQRDYVSLGYYNQIKQSSTLSPNEFDSRFSYLKPKKIKTDKIKKLSQWEEKKVINQWLIDADPEGGLNLTPDEQMSQIRIWGYDPKDFGIY